MDSKTILVIAQQASTFVEVGKGLLRMFHDPEGKDVDPAAPVFTGGPTNAEVAAAIVRGREAAQALTSDANAVLARLRAEGKL